MDKLKITPLGGIGEIGLNCQKWETKSGFVMIDCGLMFPDVDHYGVDFVIPRFDTVFEQKDRLLGIVLTHGHEDHIGALPWLVSGFFKTVHIYGSSYTLALVEHKLTEHNLIDKVELHIVNPYAKLKLGEMDFTFIPVCHSILQGYALAVQTPIGKVLHTGDFKLNDPFLSWGENCLADFKKFADEGEPIRLLLSDSTNVDREGYSNSESELLDGFRTILKEAQKRVIITLFSSNTPRIQTVLNMAKEFDRAVFVSGRSLFTNIEKAKDLGLLEVNCQVYSEYSLLPEMSDEKVIILATGSQGEPLSALSRIVAREHKQLMLNEGDTVIMSSRVIPGNMRAVSRLLNQMYKQGAKVYHNSRLIHATGHACYEELREVLVATEPDLFVPIHGEFRHLVLHKELAEKTGVLSRNAILLEDGQSLIIDEIDFDLGATVNFESVLVDGKGVGDVGRIVLKERRILGGEGLVVVVLVVAEDTGEVLHGPEIFSRGFVFEQRYDHLLEDAKCLILDVLEARQYVGHVQLEEKIRSQLRSFFRSVLSRDPVVLPIVTVV